jgi:beta-xylosidase
VSKKAVHRKIENVAGVEMVEVTRRALLGSGMILPVAASLATPGRRGDLGNGSFLNPIMAGDHPDPSILKDGPDYYMTFSSFEAYPGCLAGLLLFYNSRLYCGLAFDDQKSVMHRYGLERAGKPLNAKWLRVTNNRHIVTFHTSMDGKEWSKYDVQMEVSGYHHNVAGDFLSLRPALYATGSGEARFRSLSYETA